MLFELLNLPHGHLGSIAAPDCWLLLPISPERAAAPSRGPRLPPRSVNMASATKGQHKGTRCTRHWGTRFTRCTRHLAPHRDTTPPPPPRSRSAPASRSRSSALAADTCSRSRAPSPCSCCFSSENSRRRAWGSSLPSCPSPRPPRPDGPGAPLASPAAVASSACGTVPLRPLRPPLGCCRLSSSISMPRSCGGGQAMSEIFLGSLQDQSAASSNTAAACQAGSHAPLQRPLPWGGRRMCRAPPAADPPFPPAAGGWPACFQPDEAEPNQGPRRMPGGETGVAGCSTARRSQPPPALFLASPASAALPAASVRTPCARRARRAAGAAARTPQCPVGARALEARIGGVVVERFPPFFAPRGRPACQVRMCVWRRKRWGPDYPTLPQGRRAFASLTNAASARAASSSASMSRLASDSARH